MIEVMLLLSETPETEEEDLQMRDLSRDLSGIAEQIKLDPDIDITFYVKLDDPNDPVKTDEEGEKKIGAANKMNTLAIALVYEALLYHLMTDFFDKPEPASH